MIKQLTKVLVISMVLILALVLSACGSSPTPKDTSSPEASIAATTSPDTSDTSSPTDASVDTSSPTDSSLDTSTPSPTDNSVSSDNGNTDVSPSPDATSTPDPSATSSTSTSDLTSYKGYLVDAKSGAAGKDPAGDILKTHPEKYLVKYLTTYASSGFGLEIKQKDGTYKFYKFDTAGNSEIKKYIIGKTTKTSGLFIEVKGTLSGSTIKVTTVLKPA